MNTAENHAPHRILVVEDEAIIAMDLERRLRRLGYQVIGVADDAETALHLAEQHRPELVFMDIMIRGPRDGIEVARDLRERFDLPVVFLTAHTDPATLKRARAVGPYGYLVKPFQERELLTTVEMVVQRHADDARARMLEHAVEAAKVGAAVFDARADGRPLIYVNSAFVSHYGWSKEELIGRSPGFMLSDRADPLEVERVREAIKEGFAIETVVEMTRKDGSSVWTGLTLSPIRGPGGEVSHGLCFHQDLTHRRETEAALRRSQKMEAVGRLTAGIAHDFNNLLTVVLSFAEILQNRLEGDEQSRSDLQEVIGAGNRAADLTRQLLGLSHSRPRRPQPVDVNQAMESLLKMLRRSVGPNVEIVFVPAARPPVVRIDPGSLDQIMLNLAVNARDAMPDGGQLRLTVTHALDDGGARRVLLRVADTGTGMSEDVRRRCLEPFFTTKPVSGGTGLGLATCCELVDAAQGSLDLVSAPGEGTEVIIALPPCDAALLAPAPKPPVARAPGQRVLLAEDDPALRRVAERILRDAGYAVTAVADGRQAIEQLSAEPYDAMVTDVMMPHHGGVDVANHAAVVAPSTRVLFTTGWLDERAAGAMDPERVVWKPYTTETLLRALDRVLASAEPPARLAPVLIVEDDRRTLVALSRVLEGGGYEVEAARSVAEALEALKNRDEFAAVLCDLSLPDGSGDEILRWMQAHRAQLLPVTTLLTGGAVDPSGRALLDAAGVDVLRKPVFPSQLLAHLAERRSDPSAPPVAPPPRVAPRPQMAPISVDDDPAPLGAGDILVIDDEPATLGALLRPLRSAGFMALGAESMAEALALLRERSFDAVVSDIGLRDADGFDLVVAARRIHPTLPVVLVTGAPSVESVRRALGLKTVGYLPKPVSPGELVAEVGRAVEAGIVSRLQRNLLATHHGAERMLEDPHRTARDLDEALGKLHMAYQPILRAGDGSVFGQEALLRTRGATLSSPPDVLAAAEVLGRIDDVGHAVRWSIAETVRKQRNPAQAVFVNLHPAEVRSDLLCRPDEPLLPYARSVVLEVTERAALSSGARVIEEIAALRSAGYRIAIDDLGEGYAGLSWLVQLRPDVAKIDMSLVRDVDTSAFKRQILASLLAVCRRAEITTVCEGVETVGEATVLRDLGCDLLQGYLFAKPGAPFPQPYWPWKDGAS